MTTKPDRKNGIRHADNQLRASSQRVLTIPVKMYRPFNDQWSLQPLVKPITFEVILVKSIRHLDDDCYQVEAMSVDHWPEELRKRTKNTKLDINANIDQVYNLLEQAFSLKFPLGKVSGLKKQHVRDAITWQ